MPTFALNFYSPVVADQLRTGKEDRDDPPRRQVLEVPQGDDRHRARRRAVRTAREGLRRGHRQGRGEAACPSSRRARSSTTTPRSAGSTSSPMARAAVQPPGLRERTPMTVIGSPRSSGRCLARQAGFRRSGIPRLGSPPLAGHTPEGVASRRRNCLALRGPAAAPRLGRASSATDGLPCLGRDDDARSRRPLARRHRGALRRRLGARGACAGGVADPALHEDCRLPPRLDPDRRPGAPRPRRAERHRGRRQPRTPPSSPTSGCVATTSSSSC